MNEADSMVWILKPISRVLFLHPTATPGTCLSPSRMTWDMKKLEGGKVVGIACGSAFLLILDAVGSKPNWKQYENPIVVNWQIDCSSQSFLSWCSFPPSLP